MDKQRKINLLAEDILKDFEKDGYVIGKDGGRKLKKMKKLKKLLDDEE